MANGMELMLKSFGIDPEKIKADFKQLFETTTANVMGEVNALKEAQTRIETKLDKVLELRGHMDAMNAIESEHQTSGLVVTESTLPAVTTEGTWDGIANSTH